MKTILKYLTVIALSLLVFIPSGYAAVHHTNKSLVDWIINESKFKIPRLNAEKIVNSVLKYAHLRNIDPFLIVSLIKHESGFNPQAKSGYGAIGLMQVVPRFHRDKIKGRSMTSVDTNIDVGTQVLGDCIESHKANIRKALRCYSGGARNYTEKLAGSYKKIKRHDIVFRFEQELPLTVSGAFDKPDSFQHSIPTGVILAGI